MKTAVGILMVAAAWGQDVEFIGLEQTTQKWAEDRLERLADGRIHYCAADLKKAGYADASVIIHLADDGKLFTVVTVVEAGRASEVRQRARPSGDVPLPAAWTFDAAMDLLARSKKGMDRVVAAQALRKFGDREETWRGLVAALRDPEERVAGEAASSLQWLRMHAPRTVDWLPAAEDLTAMLHGTNLFGFSETLLTLTATRVDPAMASTLLRDGGARMLMLYLAARHDAERGYAHALLVQLHGSDLGMAPEAWQAWLDTL